MKLIVGLGNTGAKYENTRHNAGFMLIDALGASTDFGRIKNIKLVKPTTMMNASGKAVAALYAFYKIAPSDLYIAHDDLDIKLGEFKIQFGKGPKVHNGVNSVEEALGSADFWRIRIGVDNRPSDNRLAGEAYVLETFSDEERAVLASVTRKITSELLGKIA